MNIKDYFVMTWETYTNLVIYHADRWFDSGYNPGELTNPMILEEFSREWLASALSFGDAVIKCRTGTTPNRVLFFFSFRELCKDIRDKMQEYID